MYDINFYMKSYALLSELQKGTSEYSQDECLDLLESYRSKEPIVYNIETTNACNMRCRMCPRTTRMDRKITFLEQGVYESIVSQLRPHTDELWKEWEKFCEDTYGIGANDDPSENHFFLHIIPLVIQLHGYGDPLLDDNLSYVVTKLKENNLKSYFSCNPANIDIDKTVEMMECGLDYLKYSFESTDDEAFKQVRGNAANFTEAYNKTLEVIKKKNELGLKTVIIITMIDVNKENQQEEFAQLKKVFDDHNVYLYLKSEDQQWYREDETLKEYLEKQKRELPSGDLHQSKAIHWLEPCKHPWMSMTIKSDGLLSTCMEDYNNEITFGDVNKETLSEIWNGEEYKKFRNNHVIHRPCMKCTEECDMPLVGDYLATGSN